MALLRVHWILICVHSRDKTMLLISWSSFELFENLFLSLHSHNNLAVDIFNIHIFSTSMDCCICPHEGGLVCSWLHLSQHSRVGCGSMASKGIWMSRCLLDWVNWILLTRCCLRIHAMLLVVWSRLWLRVPLWRLLIHGLVFSALLFEWTNSSKLFSVGQFWWPLSHL